MNIPRTNLLTASQARSLTLEATKDLTETWLNNVFVEAVHKATGLGLYEIHLFWNDPKYPQGIHVKDGIVWTPYSGNMNQEYLTEQLEELRYKYRTSGFMNNPVIWIGW
jgi:hypothetical protein